MRVDNIEFLARPKFLVQCAMIIAVLGLSMASHIDQEPGELLDMANSLRTKGRLDSAFTLYNQALNQFQTMADSGGMATVFNSLGVYYRLRGELAKAEKVLLTSISINKRLRDRDELAKNYLNLGNLLRFQHRNNEAQVYFNECIQLVESEIITQGDVWYAASLNGLGLIYLDSVDMTLFNLDLALSTLKKSDSVFRKINAVGNAMAVENNIGRVLEQVGDLDGALRIYMSVLDYSIQYDLRPDQGEVYFNLGNVYSRMHNRDSSLSMFKKSYDIAEITDLIVLQKNSARKLVDLHMMNSSPNISSYFLEKYDSLNDQIYNDKVAEELAEQEERFKNRELTIERDLESVRADRLSLGLILSLAIILITVVLSIYLRQKQRLTKKENDLANQKINDLLQQQEINSLQGVLAGQEEERQRIATDLHDKLGAILGMVKLHFSAVEDRIDVLRDDNKKQYDKANELLDQASTEVRNISHNLLSGVLVKFGLVPALQDLKDTVEATGKLKVQLVAGEQMDGRLNGEQELQIYRIVQELISNILKHARATEAVIQLNRTNGEINLIVEDDGIGFDVESARQKQGIGLKNLEARAARLNAKLHFDSGKGAGTTVSVDIPLNMTDL